MLAIITAFVVSYILTLGLIRYEHIHGRISADVDFDSPQKFHKIPVPRIGGLSIFVALLVALLIKGFQDHKLGFDWILLFICSVPVFATGILEDITKKINAKSRLVSALISGFFACYLLNIEISSIDIEIIDYFLNIKILSILLTSLMIAGLVNSYNIIDGFNGLASMIAMLTLLAIAYVAFQVGDLAICIHALIMIAAVFGFFAWNYPKGLIFLGDGGAYFVGFWVACLSILLVVRNPQVSPWFACLINIYPVFETVFSIWRKKIIRKISPGVPDGAHLHMLVYGRIARWMRIDDPEKSFLANARTSPFLWVLSGATVIPAILVWRNTLALQLFTVLFCIIYLVAYRSLVLFKIPKWFL